MATKTRTITIYKKDIYFDIDAVTHTYSREYKDALTAMQRDRLSTDVDEQNDLAIMTRCADIRYAALKNVMAFALQTETSTATNDSLSLDATGSYTFTLSINSRFEDKNLTAITALIHEYMVKGTLKDWYELIGIPRGDLYSARLKEIEQTIKSLLIHRSIPTVTR